MPDVQGAGGPIPGQDYIADFVLAFHLEYPLFIDYNGCTIVHKECTS
jgi:hypothetical protein